MIVIYSTRILRFLAPWFPGIAGITLFPFIILRKEMRGSTEAAITINHERIHIRQQVELLVVVFAAWYVASFFRGLLRGLTLYEAYRDIIFEREAFEKMYDPGYLGERKMFAFMKYRKKR
jgi:hypothetical protein